MALEFLKPGISEDTKPFWEGAKEHKLLFQKCDNCGTFRWPAAYLCPNCLSEKNTWTECSGKGKIYSYIEFQKSFHPCAEDKVPYTVVTVDLEENVRMLSNLVNAEGKEITCGKEVKVAFEDYEDYSKPVFELKD